MRPRFWAQSSGSESPWRKRTRRTIQPLRNWRPARDRRFEMTTDRMKGVDEADDRQVSLSDVDGSVGLPGEKPKKRRGKRVMLSVLAILLLIGVAAIGGYFLLRGEQIDLKANKRLEDKRSSGSDIRKAA